MQEKEIKATITTTIVCITNAILMMQLYKSMNDSKVQITRQRCSTKSYPAQGNLAIIP